MSALSHAGATRRTIGASAIGAAAGLALGLAAGWLSARASGGLAHVRWGGLAPASSAPRAVSFLPPTGPVAARLRELDRILAEMRPGDPSGAAALLARARLFLDAARSPALALADVERLLADHPCAHEAAGALYLRVEALLHAGALPAAQDAARRFLAAFPASWRAPDAATLGADLLLARARSAEAEALLGDALETYTGSKPRTAAGLLDRCACSAPAALILMRLGRLALASGDFASAEGAFEYVARPVVTAAGCGETCIESPFLAEARVGLAEVALHMGGERESGAREALARLARRYERSPAGRRARLAAGLPERMPGGRALALAEAGRLDDAARAAVRSPPAGEAADALAGILEARAFLDPRGVLALADRIGPAGLPLRARESLIIGRAHALEAIGRAREADAALGRYSSERLALARAELARRRGYGKDVRSTLELAASSSDLAAALLERERAGPQGARGEASP